MKTKVKVEISHNGRYCDGAVDGRCQYLTNWPRCILFTAKYGGGKVLKYGKNGFTLRCKQCLEAEEAAK